MCQPQQHAGGLLQHAAVKHKHSPALHTTWQHAGQPDAAYLGQQRLRIRLLTETCV